MNKILRAVLCTLFYVAVYPLSQMALSLLAIVLGMALNLDGINIRYDIYALFGEGTRFAAENMHIVLALSMVVTFLLCVLFLHLQHQRLSSAVLHSRLNARGAFGAILMAFGARFLVAVYVLLTENTSSIGTSMERYAQQIGQLNEVTLLALFAAAVLGAPILEELLYRAFLGNELRKIMPVGTVILVSALAFGLSHMVLYQVIYAFAVGVLLGVVYYKTKSIYASILMHLIFNIASVLQTDFLGAALNALLGVAFIAAAMVMLFGRYSNKTLKNSDT